MLALSSTIFSDDFSFQEKEGACSHGFGPLTHELGVSESDGWMQWRAHTVHLKGRAHSSIRLVHRLASYSYAPRQFSCCHGMVGGENDASKSETELFQKQKKGEAELLTGESRSMSEDSVEERKGKHDDSCQTSREINVLLQSSSK